MTRFSRELGTAHEDKKVKIDNHEAVRAKELEGHYLRRDHGLGRALIADPLAAGGAGGYCWLAISQIRPNPAAWDCDHQ